MSLAACVDYAGPPPEQETESNQPLPPTNAPPTNAPPTSAPPVSTPPTSPDPDTSADDDRVSFDRDVHPILVDKCGMCHADAAPLPDHGAPDADVAFVATQGMSNNQPVYERILARASGEDGFMPPGYAGCEGPLGSEGCLSEEEFAIIELWVEQGASNR